MFMPSHTHSRCAIDRAKENECLSNVNLIECNLIDKSEMQMQTSSQWRDEEIAFLVAEIEKRQQKILIILFVGGLMHDDVDLVRFDN